MKLVNNKNKSLLNNLQKNHISSPKLMNGYGEIFDYKNSAEANLIKEKLHHKKLNLERDLNHFLLKKNLDKENYLKLKNSNKILEKSELKSIKLHHKIEIIKLEEHIKWCNNLIPISKFVLMKKLNTKNRLKNNYKTTINTIKSISKSSDNLIQKNQKIKSIHSDAIILEKQLEKMIVILSNQKIIDQLEKYSSTNKNIIIFVNDYILKFDNSLHKKMITKAFLQIYKAYQKQPYFSFENHTKKNIKNLEKDIEKLRLRKNYSIKMNLIKNKKKNEIIKMKFNDAYQDSKEVAKSNYDYDIRKIKLDELKKQTKTINNELNKEIKNKNFKIKTIKKSLNDEYKLELASYKKQNNVKFSFNLNKQECVNNSSNTFSFKLLLDYRLWNLNLWEYKSNLNEIKSKHYGRLGKSLTPYTYDGDFYVASAKILVNKTNEKSSNAKKFVNNFKNIKNVQETQHDSNNIHEWLKLNKLQIRKQYVKQLEELKSKLARKEFTREAYYNEKLKLRIFYEEDIKHLNLGLPKSKAQFLIKDTIVSYKKEEKSINNEYYSAENNISKLIPIEVKRNSAYWISLIAFIFPGLDTLILKNWKKALLLLAGSIIAWSIFIPYAFGAYNIQGNGIMGLIKLSWVVETSPVYGDLFNDSRYALVEGVIGLILLTITLCFFAINAYQSFKIVRSMEKGIRFNTWLETKKTLRTSGFPYAISLPGLFLILFIVVMPIVVSLLLAFTNIGTDHNPAAGQESNWVGFDQFVRLFSNPNFFQPLGDVLLWNFIWAISTTAIVISLGTIMALAIENKNIKCKVLWRTIFILPWAIPAFVSILFFKVIFNPTSSGLVNNILIDIGMISPNNPINWLNSQTASRTILILIQGWLGHSYMMLLVTGNMKSISGDIYEAASIDGASTTKQFFKMTAPIILISIMPLLIGQFIFNYNNFSIIFLFNDGGGKIAADYIYDVGSSDILLSWIFKITFGGQANSIESNQALAAALVIIVSIFVVAAAAIGFSKSKAFRKWE